MARPKPSLTQYPVRGGMVRDVSRHLLNEAVYDAADVIGDVDGKLRKRGGTTALMGVSESLTINQLGSVYSPGDGAAGVYGVAQNNSGGEAFTFLAPGMAAPIVHTRSSTLNANISIGRPFRYRNAIVFPRRTPGRSYNEPMIAFAGGQFSTSGAAITLATPATVAIVAGNPTVTVAAADITKLRIGMFLSALLGAGSLREYIGRIVSVDYKANTVRVYPTPIAAIGPSGSVLAYASDYALLNPGGINGADSPIPVGVGHGCAFQSRIICGGITTNSTGGKQDHPTRLMWSALPTETVTHLESAANLVFEGFIQVTNGGYPYDNFLDVEGIGDITAVVPVGPSQLLVMGASKCYRITGTFVTLATSGQSLPIDIQPISQTVGCLTDRSLQESPYGAVWASRDGVYRYDGSRLDNLMAGRIQTLWNAMQETDDFVIYGSALVRDNHYVISTSAGGLLCDLRTGAWHRYTGPSIGGSAIDPLDLTRVVASTIYDDTSTVAPTASRDVLYRIDSVIAPSGTNSVDHDGADVEASVTTKAMTPGGVARLHRHRHLTANTDLKAANAQPNGNILGPNADAEAEVYLPNADAELGTTDWWRAMASGATTLPTVTAATDQAHGGAYSIKVVTVAATGADDGVRYDLPGGYADAATIYSVECWVRLSTAGTVSLTVGANTDSTTTTGSWVRLVVRNIPGAGAVSSIAAVITHSANSATFWVDDLRVSILQPWQESGTLLTSGSVVVGDSTNAYTGGASIRCVCTTTGHGVNYSLRPTLKKNLTYTASVFAKTISGSADYTLAFGDGSVTATAAITLTSAWQKFTVSLTPTADVTAPVVAVKRASASAGTFVVDDLAVTGPDPQLDIALVGGPEAEGDYGDGTAHDLAFATFATDYEALSGTLTASGGSLAPSGAGVSHYAYHRGGCLSRDGDATLGFTMGHAGDRAGLTIDTYDANNFLYFELQQTGGWTIRKFVAGVITTLESGSVSALTLGVPYWLVASRAGPTLTLELWTLDPDTEAGGTTIATHNLSTADQALFVLPASFGFRPTAGDTTLRINDFRCTPYDNVGRVAPDPAAPSTTRGDHHLISQASTVQFRQFGQASECEFADVQLQADLLRVGRTS